tara:strand:- start:6093 stop:7370 length:1278 start_codon:yes stop_codon:yes gene_type:complete
MKKFTLFTLLFLFMNGMAISKDKAEVIDYQVYKLNGKIFGPRLKLVFPEKENSEYIYIGGNVKSISKFLQSISFDLFPNKSEVENKLYYLIKAFFESRHKYNEKEIHNFIVLFNELGPSKYVKIKTNYPRIFFRGSVIALVSGGAIFLAGLKYYPSSNISALGTFFRKTRARIQDYIKPDEEKAHERKMEEYRRELERLDDVIAESESEEAINARSEEVTKIRDEIWEQVHKKYGDQISRYRRNYRLEERVDYQSMISDLKALRLELIEIHNKRQNGEVIGEVEMKADDPRNKPGIDHSKFPIRIYTKVSLKKYNDSYHLLEELHTAESLIDENVPLNSFIRKLTKKVKGLERDHRNFEEKRRLIESMRDKEYEERKKEFPYPYDPYGKRRRLEREQNREMLRTSRFAGKSMFGRLISIFLPNES